MKYCFKSIVLSVFDKSILALSSMLITTPSFSAETVTDFTLDPILVKAKSSFDTLSEDSFIPQRKFSFEDHRSGTVESLEKREVFPSLNYGYPSGATGIKLGGISIDDTQVSTLGVPLNLPQGGGPDLSFFPSYLWSDAQLSTVPALAGFSPQGVTGSVQLELWTRSLVRDYKRSTSLSRITGSYNRNLQNFSVAQKKEDAAMMAGMNFGRQQGPAGSLSYYFIRKPRSHFLFHILGSQQEGDNPGSKFTPSPLAKKKVWRVIPVLESHQEFGDEESFFIWESTFSADLQNILYQDPNPAFQSDDRTQQYGLENAFRWNDYQLAFTARLIEYQSALFGKFEDWPVLAQLSRDFKLSEAWKMKLGAGGTWVSTTGAEPSARISFRANEPQEGSWFFELNSLPKMPTLTARYYYYPGPPAYFGNPQLKPERSSSFISGFEYGGQKVTSVTTFKAEYRNAVQLPIGKTTLNAGTAGLISLQEDLDVKPFSFLTTHWGLLLTYSKLMQTGYPYPDLPYFTLLSSSTIIPTEKLHVNRTTRYVGQSTTSSGGLHAGYVLFDASVDYFFSPDLSATLGCDNIGDSRAEMVADYPLPGRMFFANFSAKF